MINTVHVHARLVVGNINVGMLIMISLAHNTVACTHDHVELAW